MFFKLISEHLFSKINSISLKNVTLSANNIHTSAVVAGGINRMKDRTALLRSVVKKGDGIEGVNAVDIDSVVQR